MVRRLGTKPAPWMFRAISASVRWNPAPAEDTTFSSIIRLPKSFAPKRRHLSDLAALGDPARLDVREVVEHHPGHGQGPEVLERAHLVSRERGVLRLEC